MACSECLSGGPGIPEDYKGGGWADGLTGSWQRPGCKSCASEEGGELDHLHGEGGAVGVVRELKSVLDGMGRVDKGPKDEGQLPVGGRM